MLLSLVLSFGLFGYVDLRVYAFAIMLVCEKLRVPTIQHVDLQHATVLRSVVYST